MPTTPFFHAHDIYEVDHTGITIHSIRKLIGDSQYPRTLKFSDLPEELQDEILVALAGDQLDET